MGNGSRRFDDGFTCNHTCPSAITEGLSELALLTDEAFNRSNYFSSGHQTTTMSFSETIAICSPSRVAEGYTDGSTDVEDVGGAMSNRFITATQRDKSKRLGFLLLNTRAIKTMH